MASETPPVIVETVRDAESLRRRVDEWDDLARHALEANIFYESPWLLAILRHFDPGVGLCFLFVYRADAATPGGRRLIGFFPFMRAHKGPRGLISCYRMFQSFLCYLCTPLVYREHAELALDGLFDWIDGRPDGVRLFALYHIAGDGPVGDLIGLRCAARRQPLLIENGFVRALFRPAADTESFLARTVRRKKRKELRRQRRRLEKLGPVTVTTRAGDPDGDWSRRFLSMEADCWKGSEGNALGRFDQGLAFFRELMDAFVADGRVILHTLAVAGRPVAMKVNIVAADGKSSFAFKIAHDPDFARYSPGVLLELENIADLHRRADRIAYMDSCADPDHPMIDSLWCDRRLIVYALCAGRGLAGRGLMVLFGILHRRWLKRQEQRGDG